ncbi:MAG TPA: Fic family protein [Nitrososphaeraceae archaeon]|nr:Fic family protein [Nitrososphaeraceae archaeon]
MSSAEQFIDSEIQEIVKFNIKIVKERNERQGVNLDRLNEIFSFANSINPDIEPDRKKRILKKAARIISGITWLQPFDNGNKSTALASGKMFLNRNGFDLSINNKQIYFLLERISMKFENDSSIYSEREEFLFKKVFDISNGKNLFY